MRFVGALLVVLLPQTVLGCGAPVCLVDPDSLALPLVITFDDIPSSAGPGYLVDEVLALAGARFGERFNGQEVENANSHDRIVGDAIAPLSVVAGAAGQNLSVVHFYGNAVLNGYGTAGFPRREAQGEGAIAVLFDEDQAAIAFDLRGGEAGTAEVTFLRRDGLLIARVPVTPTGEFAVGFMRDDGTADIAGVIVTNSDPQGLAIDTLRFGRPPDLS